MKRIRILAATLFLAFLALPALAGQGNGKNLLVHMITGNTSASLNLRVWNSMRTGR